MNDLITIVVPVYNVEKYLPHTLESICGQTYTNLQILLIDDGSTDDSLAVCHKWARQDNRIQVYEQENQGVARTRNKGIQLATGKYVMFLDADDWVEADMLESLYRLAEADHADVACCLLREENQLEEKDNCTITERTIIHGKNKTESGLALLTVWGPVCKLYRKDLIENIQFEEYKVAEDLLFNTNVVCSKKFERASLIQYPFYHYMIYAGSVSRVFEKYAALSPKKKKQYKAEFKYCKKFAREHKNALLQTKDRHRKISGWLKVYIPDFYLWTLSRRMRG